MDDDEVLEFLYAWYELPFLRFPQTFTDINAQVSPKHLTIPKKRIHTPGPYSNWNPVLYAPPEPILDARVYDMRHQFMANPWEGFRTLRKARHDATSPLVKARSTALMAFSKIIELSDDVGSAPKDEKKILRRKIGYLCDQIALEGSKYGANLVLREVADIVNREGGIGVRQ